MYIYHSKGSYEHSNIIVSWNQVTSNVITCYCSDIHFPFTTALDLLEKLLVFESSLRLSAEEALAHPYLQQFSCIEDEPIVLTPFHIEHEVNHNLINFVAKYK